MAFLLRSCSKCGGDLILDEGDWNRIYVVE